MSVIIKLLSKFDDSGLRKAKSGFGGLSKSFGAIGIGFGLKQLGDGLLDAAKAASVDAKSMQLLNNQLVRNAGATEKQVTANNAFIDTLSMQVGIADDVLRPAQARLARATGSVTKSQELLGVALDASAVSGRPLESVSTALAKAYNGNTTSLKRMFPELSKSKDIIGDLTKAVKGAAEEQADPFARMNVAFGELQEKLGAVILPYLLDFIDTMMMPGGAIDQVGKFLEDVSNPKTEAGQTFIQVKDAISAAVGAVKEFFGFFGDGDAVKGFATIATNLIKALPALLALKGIMMLASAGNSIANLAKAIALMTGANVPTPAPAAPPLAPVTNPVTSGPLKALSFFKLLPMLGVGFGSTGDISEIDPNYRGPTGSRPNVFSGFQKPAPSITNNVTINATNADPKSVVSAVGTYIKQNGSLPFNLSTGRKVQ